MRTNGSRRNFPFGPVLNLMSGARHVVATTSASFYGGSMMRQCLLFILAFSLQAGASSAQSADLYFPNKDWEKVSPAAAGWDEAKLSAALDFAMSRKSSGIVVLYRGRILAERYATLKSSFAYRRVYLGQNKQQHPIEDVASVQKSVVSFLMGIAQEKGLVKIDDTVSKHLGAGWSRAKPKQEQAITIRHLLTMSSGLNDKLAYASPPGTVWKYNTSAYSQNLRVIAAAAKMTPNELTQEWLTQPAGMHDSKWVDRSWRGENNTSANRYGFATTPRDLARFGLLIMAKGKWADQTLLADQDYLQASTTPSQKLNPSYGFLWWLNGQKTTVRVFRRVNGPLISTAPPDLVAALGALGRKCYVVPSHELVVTRLGDNPEVLGTGKFDKQLWDLLMQAAPKAEPSSKE